MRYLESVKTDPPLFLYSDTKFQLFAIDDSPNRLRISIAWSEYGEPMYFKRGIEYANKLFLFTDGEDLTENTEKL